MRASSSRGARLALVAVALLSSSVAESARAQRNARADKPTGAEIAMKARTARLDRANAGSGAFQGKRIAFTPAVLPAGADLAAGQMIGLLENDVDGDETGLPAGRYNVFAAQLADGWHVYAESGGQIVREALRVTVTRRPGAPPEKKPRIRPVGWGVDVDLSGGIHEEALAPVASITVKATTPALHIGERAQYAIELRDAAGNLLAGRRIAWTSNAPTIAGTPLVGVASGVNPGTATLSAAIGGKTATVDVQVQPLTYYLFLGGVSVTNNTYRHVTSLGQTSTVTMSGGAGNCAICPPFNPGEVAWTISDPALATFSTSSNTLRIVPTRQGTATMTATYHGVQKSFVLTVEAAKAAQVTISPASLTVAQGQASQVSGYARDAVGVAMPSSTIVWSSTDPAIADVTPTGRVAGISPGIATIVATAQAVSSSIPVRVTLPPVASVTVSPAPLTVQQRALATLGATLKDQAGNVVTGRSVIWTSSNPLIADVTSGGTVIGVAPGVATITATSEGRAGSTSATVTAVATATDQPTETISFNW